MNLSSKWKRVAVVTLSCLAALALVLTLGGRLIEPRLHLEHTRVVQRPAEQLRPYLTSSRGLSQWWARAGTMRVRHAAGPEEGPGLVVQFEEGDRPIERWTVLAATADEVRYRVEFIGLFEVERSLKLRPEPSLRNTRVVWTETGSIDNPLVRWFRVLMPDAEVKQNFDKALLGLEAAPT